MGPDTWILKHTPQDLSFDMRHAYLIVAWNLALDDPSPPPYEILSLYSSSRPFIWYAIWLPFQKKIKIQIFSFPKCVVVVLTSLQHRSGWCYVESYYWVRVVYVGRCYWVSMVYVGRCYWHRILSVPLLLYWKHTLCSYISAENTYYHYTNGESASKILKGWHIQQSESKYGDAPVGDGAYLTKYGPSTPRTVVAKNNWPRYWEHQIRNGKTDIAFEMSLPNVKNYSHLVNRDVYLYPAHINLLEVQGLKVHSKTGDTTYNTLDPENYGLQKELGH